MKKSDIVTLSAWIIACLLAGVFGSFFTMEAIPAWYAGLDKPSFTPPDYAFGPVWTALYILMGASAYLVYKQGAQKIEVQSALKIFALQLILNSLWSVAFFGMHSPLAGMIVILILWLAIADTINRFYPISKSAALLMMPYIAWVTYAAILNIALIQMNP